MAEIHTIKGISDEDWLRFKSMAAKSGQNMGQYLVTLMDSYEDRAKKMWAWLFNMKPFLSDEDAKAILKASKEMRAEYGFRDKK